MQRADPGRATSTTRIRGILIVGGTLCAVLLTVWLVADHLAREAVDSETDEIDARIAAAALSEEKQQYIWDIEHVTFELESQLGQPLIASLRERDLLFMGRQLTADFAGRWLESEQATERRHASLRERTFAAETGETTQSANDFLQRFNASIGDWTRIERGRLRVLELTRDSEAPASWHAKTLLTLGGTNASGEPVILESKGEWDLHIEDDDLIGSLPMIERWVETHRSERTGGEALFEEVTSASGLSEVALIDNWELDRELARQYWFQMAVADYDLDGDLDIAAASFLGQPFLLRCETGLHYQDVADSMRLASWTPDDQRLINLAVWIDYDNDGYPDLLLGDRLYHNERGERFVDVTRTSNLFIRHHAMGGVVADYDCDGLLDLYLLYQEDPRHPAEGPQPWVGDTESGMPNELWRNEGNGRFRNVTAESGAGGGRRKSFAAVWHFLDDDHYPDLYIANDFGNNVHLRNRGDGTFEDVSVATGMEDFATSMGVAAGDLNNDGFPEFYVANMYSKMGRRIIANVTAEDYPPGIYEQILGSCAGNRLYRRGNDDEVYTDISEPLGVNPVGWAYAPAMLDVDGDGWLDLYASTGFMSFDRHKPDG